MIVIAFLLYLLMFYVTGAGMWSSWHAEFYSTNRATGQWLRRERQDWAGHILCAAIPLFWILGFFLTGFYCDGFDWKWIKRPVN